MLMNTVNPYVVVAQRDYSHPWILLNFLSLTATGLTAEKIFLFTRQKRRVVTAGTAAVSLR